MDTPKQEQLFDPESQIPASDQGVLENGQDSGWQPDDDRQPVTPGGWVSQIPTQADIDRIPAEKRQTDLEQLRGIRDGMRSRRSEG